MIGPSASAIARFTVATSSFRDVSGSCTAVTRSPPSSRSGITFDHEEPSAHAPCTRITFEALVIPIPPFLPHQSRRREGGAYRPSIHVVAIRPQSSRGTVFADPVKLLRSPGSFNCRKRQSFDREGQRDVCKHCTRNWHRALSWRAGGLYLGPYRFVRRRCHGCARSTAIWPKATSCYALATAPWPRCESSLRL